MPLQATSGAASYDAFGGGVAAVPNYIEDVFSTYLYTSSGTSSQNATISNGVDFTKGGSLIWTKSRSNAIDNYLVYRDSSSSAPGQLISNSTAAAANDNPYFTYLSTGYRLPNFADSTVGTASGSSGQTFASWTFREQPKFFDVVTFTQTGGSGTFTTFNHNLGSAPGMVLLKATGASYPWFPCYHRSLGNDQFLVLNETSAAGTFANTFSVNSTSVTVNNNLMLADGATYVAYLFAHNAGGFGLTGTDNVISCGSFTTDGSGIIPTVNLGYEPQWVLAKPSSGTGNWFIMDNMRGWYNQQADQGNALFPNTSGAEAAGYNAMIPTATGFTGPAVNFGAGVTYIYIAIRRGPMRTPTTGTEVFGVDTADSVSPAFDSSFPVDMEFYKNRTSAVSSWNLSSRLTGEGQLNTNNTNAEGSSSANKFDYQNGWGNGFADNSNIFSWMFRRAPGFMDVCCYTGTGSVLNVAHNLGVAPELMIVKGRSDTGGSNWCVYSAPTSAGGFLRLNGTSAYSASSTQWNNTAPTSTQFTLGTRVDSNSSGQTYVAYLFASAPGVSKVGGYTGTGTTQTINCGFTAGARFVLIGGTDDVGDWYVWDSARGIVAGDDPYLLLNSTAAEVTNTDFIDTAATGFEISSTAPAAINASGGTFIFLAIA